MSRLLVLRILKSLNERELWSAHSSGSLVLYTRESRGKFCSPFPHFFLSSNSIFKLVKMIQQQHLVVREKDGWTGRGKNFDVVNKAGSKSTVERIK